LAYGSVESTGINGGITTGDQQGATAGNAGQQRAHFVKRRQTGKNRVKCRQQKKRRSKGALGGKFVSTGVYWLDPLKMQRKQFAKRWK
jgi:hypothetical protein